MLLERNEWTTMPMNKNINNNMRKKRGVFVKGTDLFSLKTKREEGIKKRSEVNAADMIS